MRCDKNSSQIYSAKVVPLKDLLLDSNKYEIPEYQRPYAWEEKHWEDLWNDLQRAYSKKSEYLLGSIYLNENGEILDGQQRFTALYMFLKCLDFNKDELCNIKLGGNDKEFFEKIKKSNDIKDIGEPQTASQKRLKGCYEFFKNDKKCKNEKIKMLKLEMEKLKKDNDFKDFIKNKVFLIKTMIDDKDKTHSIVTFITQTDRGKRLSNLEKIKSNLYYAAYTLFNDKEELKKRQDDIKNVFGECYKHINILYDKPEKGERMIVEALYGLLLKTRSQYKAKQDEVWKLGWMSGEDRITDEINKILSNNITQEKTLNFLFEILGNLNKIKNFLKEYSLTICNNELFHNELDLNRYTLVAMIEGKYTNEMNEPQPTTKRNSETEQWLDKQELNLNKYTSLKNKEFTLMLSSDKILNQKLIERTEFSIFRAGNSPYSEFLSNPIRKTQSYKYEYLYLLKKGIKFKNYRYFLFAYEKFCNPNFNYKTQILDRKDEYGESIKIEREHLFAQNPTEEYWDKIKQGFKDNKVGYEEWKNQIGNILLLPKTINIKISNTTPWEKADEILTNYKEDIIHFKTTLTFLMLIRCKCKNKSNDSEKILEVKKLCEQRTKRLKSFIWHRF